MIRIYSAADTADAQLVYNLLTDRDIKAVVLGDNLWGARGELPLNAVTAPSVWVNEPDVERARELVVEYEKHVESTAPAWQCTGCGEQVEGQFTACWKCGRQREDG